MNFVSDHLYGAHDKVIEAVLSANQALTASSYSDDDWTARAANLASDVFERQVHMFLVTSGTAANALGLATIAHPLSAIFAHNDSHIVVDECGAVELQTSGANIHGLDGPSAKISAAGIEAALGRFVRGVHDRKPAAISITQATELGTIYEVGEVAAIGDAARRHGLRLHMDGARFANAVAALGCSPADVTWKAGVDVMSFGVTKNGGLGVDAVLIFDPELATDFDYRRLRAGQLLSKSRFLGAQMQAYLTDGLWLANAQIANTHASTLLDGLAGNNAIRIPLGAQTNQLFAIITKTLHDHLQKSGAEYNIWPSSVPDIGKIGDDELLIRLVTSFKTDPDHVGNLIATVKSFRS